MKQIDDQTVNDIVALIEADRSDPERLASLIFGRLGYEIPSDCLPDITQGEWEIVGSKDAGPQYIVYSAVSRNVANVWALPDAKLIAAAPKLVQALYRMRQALDNHEVMPEETWRNIIEEPLIEAGAKL